MRFHKTLDTKFKHIEQKQTDVKSPPVSATLRAFLENESQRIDNLIAKKKMCQHRLQQIERKDLSSREKLRIKIEEEHEKHEKKRKEFLQKRVKTEKLKIDEVQRKRTEHLTKVKEKKKNNQLQFKRHKSATEQFWNTKSFLTKKSFDNQSAVPPLYEDSVSRKKMIEKRNQMYGEQQKDKLLLRHSKVQQRIEALVYKKEKILDQYNQKLRKGYEKNQQILQTKQSQFINKICYDQDRSKKVVKKNQKEWEKKLQTKHKLDDHMVKTSRQNFIERTQKRAQSMKNCRCHDRGSSPEAGLTNSIVLNEQDGSNQNFRKTVKPKQGWSVLETRRNFMMQSQTNLSSVLNNKSMLRQKQDMQHQKKLMIEKEISNAVKSRSDIRNQSNLLVRQAKILA